MIPFIKLLKRQGKNGEFWAGKIGEASVMFFEDKRATHPTLSGFLVEDRPRPQTQAQAPQRERPKITPRPQPQNFAPTSPPANDFHSDPWPESQDGPPDFGF